MYRIALLLTFTIVSSTAVLAGTVNILPLKPTAGQTIAIEYRPDATLAKELESAGNVHAVVYAFEIQDEVPDAIEVPLKFDGQRWTGTVVLPATVVYGVVKVGVPGNYDTNKEMFWGVRVHDKTGRPVEGAFFKEAQFSMGVYPSHYNREADLVEAAELIQEELTLYPNNLDAFSTAITIKVQSKEITVEEAQRQMAAVSGSSRRSFTPADRVAEQQALQRYSTATSAGGFLDSLEKHLATYPNSPSARALYAGAIDAGTKGSELPHLVAMLERLPNAPPSTINDAVNYIGAVDTLRPRALALIDRAVVLAENPNTRPPDMGMSEWNEEKRITVSNLHFVRGAILRAQSNNAEAIVALRRAIEIGHTEVNKSAYDMSVSLLQFEQKSEEALSLAVQGISSGVDSPLLITTYRAVLTSQGKDSVSIERDLAVLREKGSALQGRRMMREMLNLPMIDGSFTTIDGKPMPMSAWKGKVVVIDYWATWCGPCRASFPALQKLYDKYRNNPNVAFAVVNVWERGEDRVKIVKDFLAKNPTLTFPVYMDLKDKVVGKYGVTGIPTKFWLDKNGRIQFKEVGGMPEEQFLEEGSKKIDMLLNQ